MVESLSLRPGKPYTCAICKHLLIVLEYTDGTMQAVHNPASPLDHVPQPVDSEALPFIRFCDFCLEEAPHWKYPCDEFVVEKMRSYGEWYACDTCHGLILLDNWQTLLARAMRATQANRRRLGQPPVSWHGIVTQQAALALTWSGFRASRTGEPQWVE
jgi:hypothetical protein